MRREARLDDDDGGVPLALARHAHALDEPVPKHRARAQRRALLHQQPHPGVARARHAGHRRALSLGAPVGRGVNEERLRRGIGHEDHALLRPVAVLQVAALRLGVVALERGELRGGHGRRGRPRRHVVAAAARAGQVAHVAAQALVVALDPGRQVLVLLRRLPAVRRRWRRRGRLSRRGRGRRGRRGRRCWRWRRWRQLRRLLLPRRRRRLRGLRLLPRRRLRELHLSEQLLRRQHRLLAGLLLDQVLRHEPAEQHRPQHHEPERGAVGDHGGSGAARRGTTSQR